MPKFISAVSAGVAGIVGASTNLALYSQLPATSGLKLLMDSALPGNGAQLIVSQGLFRIAATCAASCSNSERIPEAPPLLETESSAQKEINVLQLKHLITMLACVLISSGINALGKFLAEPEPVTIVLTMLFNAAMLTVADASSANLQLGKVAG